MPPFSKILKFARENRVEEAFNYAPLFASVFLYRGMYGNGDPRGAIVWAYTVLGFLLLAGTYRALTVESVFDVLIAPLAGLFWGFATAAAPVTIFSDAKPARFHGEVAMLAVYAFGLPAVAAATIRGFRNPPRRRPPLTLRGWLFLLFLIAIVVLWLLPVLYLIS